MLTQVREDQNIMQHKNKINFYERESKINYIIFILKGGNSVSTGTLTVKGRLPEESSDTDLAEEMEPARPVLQVPLKDQSVFEGKKVRLDCVIVAQPEPEVCQQYSQLQHCSIIL